ncbi:hypothetical protein RchiOBHm_Chr2g0171321 [Rosa chinensis]|uniref:Uncharacterized protein n=1 Tax=Rosa chinensis TaxID=74649 RepID=A0A2P6S5C8_ROSCH|nr:hypothetical protein RchiOBHm_Chr2g0171321 [Rosa chinensis]
MWGTICLKEISLRFSSSLGSISRGYYLSKIVFLTRIHLKGIFTSLGSSSMRFPNGGGIEFSF